MERKQIAILTTFSKLERAYSLVSVALTQCIQLHRAGYEPHLLVNTNFEADPDSQRLIEKMCPSTVIETCVPTIIVHDYKDGNEGPAQEFDSNVNEVYRFLEEFIVGRFTRVILHDLMTGSWYVEFNQAIKQLAPSHPEIRWLAWSHSCVQPPPPVVVYPGTLRYVPTPNTYYVFLNKEDRGRFAQRVNIKEQDVKIVPNCKYPQEFFDFDPWSIEIVDKAKLLDADLLLTIATRICKSKQVDKIVKLGGAFRSKGMRAKVVVINSYSNNDDSKAEIAELKELSVSANLGAKNLIFVGDMYPEEYCFSPKVVRDLTQISDILFLPSVEEAHNLTLIEASLCRNLLVLNDDFPPVKSLYGDGALYAKCSSTLMVTSYGANNTLEEEMGYWRDTAVRIMGELFANTIWVNWHNQKVNNQPDRIFARYLEPLLC